MHSALKLSAGWNLKFSDEVLHEMRNKYRYLKVLLIDEMIGKETFNHTDLALKLIKGNSLPFGGVYILTIGDFLQLPAIKQKLISMNEMKGTSGALSLIGNS